MLGLCASWWRCELDIGVQRTRGSPWYVQRKGGASTGFHSSMKPSMDFTKASGDGKLPYRKTPRLTMANQSSI